MYLTKVCLIWYNSIRLKHSCKKEKLNFFLKREHFVLKKKQLTVFCKNIIIHLMIVFLFTLMLLPLKNKIDQTVHQSELKERNAVLTNAMASLSDNLSSLRMLLYQTRSNEYFTRLAIIDDTLHPSDYLAINNAQKHIQTIANANPLIADILVFIDKPSLVLSKATSYFGIDTFQKLYQFEGTNTEQMLFDRTFNGRNPSYYAPCTHIASLASGGNDVAFSYQMPIFDYSKGKAVLLIDKNQLLNALISNNLENYASFSLMDDKQNVIFSYVPTHFEAKNAETLHIQDENSALTLSFSLTQSYFVQTLKGVRSMLFNLLLIALLGAVLLSIYLAYRQSLPVKKLMETFKGENTQQSQNAYNWIKDKMLALEDENTNVLSQLDHMKEDLHALTLERLLNHSALDLVDSDLNSSYFAFLKHPFVIAYVFIDQDLKSRKHKNLMLLAAKKALTDVTSKKTLFHTISQQEFIFIFPLEQQTEPLPSLVDKIQSTLDPLYACVAFSNVHTSPQQVNIAFEEAQHALFQKKSSIVSQKEQVFTEDNLQKLYHFILLGEKEEAFALLDFLLYAGDTMQSDMAQRYYAIRMQMLFASKTLNESISVLKYSATLSQEVLRASLTEGVEHLCQTALNHKASEQSKRKQEVLAYVDENYLSPNFCPKDIAEHFNFSERYIFTFFKDLTNTTPANYILSLRMEKAKSLLQSTSLSVKDVGEQSGFSSFDTYYKAFKRMNMITPSVYRELALNKKQENI